MGWDILYPGMIEHISVRDFAILNKVELDLKEGLTIITGETGSGKSILVQAIGVCLGGKTTDIMVRSQSDRAVIEASINQESYRRVIYKSGRARSFISDEPVREPEYKKSTQPLVDFHGQHEQQHIMKSQTHIDYLDQYAGLGDKVDEISELFQQIQKGRRNLTQLRQKQTRSEEMRELYRFQLRELETVDPQPGEDEAITEELKILTHAQELVNALQDAAYKLTDSDNALSAELTEIIKSLDRLSRYDQTLASFTESLKSSLVLIRETTDDISRHASGIENNPERQTALDERLQALEMLKRKYGGSLEAVIKSREKVGKDLESIQGLGDQILEAEKILSSQEKQYRKLALELHNKRKNVSKSLAHELESVLGELAMSDVQVDIRLSINPEESSFCQLDGQPVAAGEKGIDEIEFYLSANPGEALKPLANIASGGEISRIMLGLKTVFQKTDPVDTMIFDEIDTGISGSTASKVAQSLKSLSGTKQVICITHLPQIAAQADHHLHVTKSATVDTTDVHFEYIEPWRSEQVLAELTALTPRN